MTDQPTPEARAEATIEALDDILSGHGTEGAGDIIDRLADLARAAIRDGDEARAEVERLRGISTRLAGVLRDALPMHSTKCPIPRDDCNCWVGRQRAALAEFDGEAGDS